MIPRSKIEQHHSVSGQKMVTFSSQSMPNLGPDKAVTDISDSQVSIQIAAPVQEGEANGEPV